jgi:hypothetical protein
MSSVLTVRLSAPLERRLAERGRREKLTPSQFVRAALEKALSSDVPEGTLRARGEKCVGAVTDGDLCGADAERLLSDWVPEA